MTSYHFDNKMSIYIPRVHNCSHIKDSRGEVYENLESFIAYIFHTNNIGKVKKVDLVPIPGSKGKKSNFSKAFLHFDIWYPDSYVLQEKIRLSEIADSNTPFRMMYAAPHYWILKKNTSIGEIKKIDILEKQLSELSLNVIKCNELLASANYQLSYVRYQDNIDNEITSCKRSRNH